MKDAYTKIADLIDSKLSPVVRVVLVIGMVILFFMMLVTTTDVVGRSFNHPILGAHELASLSMVCLVAFGIAYCQYGKNHLNVVVLYDRLPKIVQKIITSLANLIGIVGISLMCWQTFVLANRYIYIPRGGFTEELHLPYGIFMIIFGIGIGFAGLLLLIDLLNSIVKVFRE